MKYLEKYEIGLALGEITRFFWGFCDDYIEIIKNRVYKPEIYGEDARKSGLKAAYHVLFKMIQCFAIYIPHITEEIYQGYFRQFENKKSIHITEIGLIGCEESQEKKEYEIGEIVIEIIALLRKYKSENNISLKTELKNVDIILPQKLELENALEDIMATCACKSVNIIYGEKLEVLVKDNGLS